MNKIIGLNEIIYIPYILAITSTAMTIVNTTKIFLFF